MGSTRTKLLATTLAAFAAGTGAAVIALPGVAAPGGGKSESAKKKGERQPLFGVLLGKKERDADGKKGAGDPDGRGSATAIIDLDTDELCYGLTVKDIGTPVAAHIHQGKRRQNGPVVVDLAPTFSGGDPGAASGCVAIDADLAMKIMRKPKKFYWNVHNAEYPAGALRDQLSVRRR